MDEDCITELAVHYGKTKEEMEKDVGEVCLYEPRHEKTCFMPMRTTKVQICLRIRAV